VPTPKSELSEELKLEDLEVSDNELFGEKESVVETTTDKKEESAEVIPEPAKSDNGAEPKVEAEPEAEPEKTPEQIIEELKEKVTEKEIERRLSQSELDYIKAQQQKASTETLPTIKTVPLDNLSPEDFMPEGETYLSDEAGIKGTPSHKAWQSYHREVTERLHAEQVERDKAKTADEIIASDYSKFQESIKGDKSKLDVVNRTIQRLSSTDPKDFVGYDTIYKIGLLLDGKLSVTQKDTVEKITTHKSNLASRPAAPFGTATQREVEITDDAKVAKEEQERLDAELGPERTSFLDGAIFEK